MFPGLVFSSLKRLKKDLPNDAPSGNIHEFVAKSPCAVLDLLVPPYHPEYGVDCTYFKVSYDGTLPTAALRPGDLVTLEVRVCLSMRRRQ